jgi:pilus assembly protein Flp/PilA
MLEKFITFMLVGRKDEEKGATAVEYGLMVALIAVAIITVVGFLGEGLSDLFQTVLDALPGGGA